ncbi:hypothetical protein [Streptosporangium sp. NPDC051022]|uniref:hypothetical protein n=1 Tax=Streptosporangium sp. NPDC051022 TaxID=3155752 RepID=UPI00341A7A91
MEDDIKNGYHHRKYESDVPQRPHGQGIARRVCFTGGGAIRLVHTAKHLIMHDDSKESVSGQTANHDEAVA